MLHLLVSAAWLLGAPHSLSPADTLDVARLPLAPTIDGRVNEREYGLPALHVVTGAGEVRVWVARHGDFIYLAATIPDSTFYWGDDFVASLNPNGAGGTGPGDGDRQWYLRRVLDSSVVAIAENGRWYSPGHEPPMLGSTRHHPDWDVASTSSRSGWTVELRIREAVVKSGPGAPRLAVRTYNDRPRGWWSWPEATAAVSAQRVERTPDLGSLSGYDDASSRRRYRSVEGPFVLVAGA